VCDTTIRTFSSSPTQLPLDLTQPQAPYSTPSNPRSPLHILLPSTLHSDEDLQITFQGSLYSELAGALNFQSSPFGAYTIGFCYHEYTLVPI